MIAVARVTVNHDGRSGTAPDPLVWDEGGRQKALKLAVRVNVDLASLPGRPGFLSGPWMQVHGGYNSGADVAAWPCSVGILCRFTSFLGTLHWTTGSEVLGHFEVFFLRTSYPFRAMCEKVTRPRIRGKRPILIPSGPVSEEIEIRHGCQFFISSLVRALAKLPGDISRFLPCGVGSHVSS